MISLIWGSSFKRSFRKTIENNRYMKKKFVETIGIFVEDPFHPALRTHKLSGRLKGLWAFSIDYDCRVIFMFLDDGSALLIDIGTHDEVY
ncbi:MAG: type II toxin-antitoxin system YafQ family toxin [Peptococcaceae bacterium]|nr:type II toxin-antitoxin system YafQ family toxin [Peptococcaceae bacterium]